MYADKHERLWSIPIFPKYQVCNVLTISQKKTFRDEVDFFCMQINIKVSYKLISTLWTSKFPTRWYYHYWWAWSSILKVFKVTSLHYLYNISKKKLGMEFIFCMPVNIKVPASWQSRFWWKWPDMSKVPKIGSYIFAILKKCCNCWCVLLLWKTFRYFTGIQSCSLECYLHISFD